MSTLVAAKRSVYPGGSRRLGKRATDTPVAANAVVASTTAYAVTDVDARTGEATGMLTCTTPLPSSMSKVSPRLATTALAVNVACAAMTVSQVSPGMTCG